MTFCFIALCIIHAMQCNWSKLVEAMGIIFFLFCIATVVGVRVGVGVGWGKKDGSYVGDRNLLCTVPPWIIWDSNNSYSRLHFVLIAALDEPLYSLKILQMMKTLFKNDPSTQLAMRTTFITHKLMQLKYTVVWVINLVQNLFSVWFILYYYFFPHYMLLLDGDFFQTSGIICLLSYCSWNLSKSL